MNPSILLSLALCCFAITKPAHADPVTVHMIGDSTMADKPVIPANPERGWGQMLHMYLKETALIANHARNGRSTKSFIEGGRWDKVLATLKPGDHVIIQFGHNDEKLDNEKVGTKPEAEYTANLKRFIREARERKAIPILATPVSRRNFDDSGTVKNSHGAYAEATRKLAQAEKVPLLDLFAATEEALQRLGPEQSKRWFVWTSAGEFSPNSKAIEDDSHFNTYGATRVCDLAVVEIEQKAPTLAVHLLEGIRKPKPTTPTP
jgi:lysophospholipase L1-like esterase